MSGDSKYFLIFFLRIFYELRDCFSFAVAACAVILFATEKLSVALVALLIMATLLSRFLFVNRCFD